MKKKSMTLGDKIKALRMKKKMSLREFCDLTGVHFTQIIRYEQNRVKPSEIVLKRIADGMDLPVTYFGGNLVKEARVSTKEREKLIAMKNILEMLEEMPEKHVIRIEQSIKKAHDKLTELQKNGKV